MTLELIEANDALAHMTAEEYAAFVAWCADLNQPMDDAHLPALLETWLRWVTVPASLADGY